MAHGSRLILAAFLVAAAFVLAPGGRSAYAEINGPCTATVRGVAIDDLSSTSAGDAIEVESDELIPVELSTTNGATFDSHKFDLEILGFKVNIQDDPSDSDPTITDTIDASDYSSYGVGLYKVSGTAHLSDGSNCTGSLLIQIKGNPLTTAAGIAALAVGVVGAIFLALAALATVRQFRAIRGKVEAWGAEQLERIAAGQDVSVDELAATLRSVARPPGMLQLWMLAALPALLLMGAAMPGGMPSLPSLPLLRLPRLPFRPKLSALTSLGGGFLGESVVAFLNFVAVQPLTGSSAIFAAVAGIVLGVAFDSAVKWFGTRDVNKVISRLELQLAEAKKRQAGLKAGIPPAPPPTPAPPEPPSEPPPGSPPPV